MRVIRIGNGAGFWGDQLDAPQRLVAGTPLDYLTLEYLAELTLSILAHLKSRDPEAGFVTDLPVVVESLVEPLRTQPSLKLVTNGGGMNPLSAARAVAAVLCAHGLGETTIGIVAGDDLLPRLPALQAAGETFAHFDTGKPIDEIRDRLASANAYLGAEGIVAALGRGARIVITGRVADASLTVGPAVHEFGWNWDDHPRLAAATVAGHLIECGAQVTGGMYSAWTPAISLADIGYPVAEVSAAGEVVITKPEQSGGAVTPHTVAEQLVYEIGDPAHYLTPDLDADFSRVELKTVGENRVAVTGARGDSRPARLKVSMAYRDGYMAVGQLVFCGPEAARNAQVGGEIILSRLKAAGIVLDRTQIEVLGTGDGSRGLLQSETPLPEVVLRVSAAHASRAPLERFLREFAPLVAAGPPGVTGYTGPRTKPMPVFAYWPSMIAREHVPPLVDVRTAAAWAACNPQSTSVSKGTH